MEKSKKEIIAIPSERIASKIFLIRGKKVILDKDIAELYLVKAIVLRQAVKRNIKRFPADFMFQLNKEEAKLLVSHFVIPSMKYLGGYLPYAFTELREIFEAIKYLLMEETKTKEPIGFSV